jgi:hypothetical protein
MSALGQKETHAAQQSGHRTRSVRGHIERALDEARGQQFSGLPVIEQTH